MTKSSHNNGGKPASGQSLRLGNGRSSDRQFRQEMYALRRFLKAGRKKYEAPDDSFYRRNGGFGHVKTGGLLSQRVLVKGRVVKSKPGRTARAIRAHLKYLTRSGVGIDEKKPTFFSDGRVVNEEELAKSVSTWGDDPHHFRFIISPEKGAELDLPTYARAVMASVERDLRTRLEWYGVCHYNTDNPHVHVLVRGVTELGTALIIDKDYMKHGFRLTAEAEATRILGHRSAKDKRMVIERGLTEKRLTALDRAFIQEQKEHQAGLILIPSGNLCKREWEVKLRLDKLTRLQFLGSLGLATNHGNGRFEVHKDLEETLRTLGRQEEIRKKVLSLVEGRSVSQELVIHDERDGLKEKLTGEVLAKELTDELSDRKFVLLSGTDGRLHYVCLSAFSEPEGFGIRPGAIVTIKEATKHHRADEVISRSVEKGGGVFSLSTLEADLKLAQAEGRWSLPDDLSMPDYLERFRTRCHTLVEHGICTVQGTDRWVVPADLMEKVKELDKKLSVKAFVEVEAESYLSLKEQVAWKGATWLDALIGNERDTPDPRSAFGSEVSKALAERLKTLTEQGVAIGPDLPERLYTAERLELRKDLSIKLGKEQALTKGQSVSGTVYGYKGLGSGQHMVVRLKDGFVVVPVARRQKRLDTGSRVKVEGMGRAKTLTGWGARYRVSQIKAAPDLGQGLGKGK